MSMDSGTSESFQSSNGVGDLDDFDSRTRPPDPISCFLNHLSPPQPPPIRGQSSRTIFDPFLAYHSTTSSFISDLDAATWPPPPFPPTSAPNSTHSTSASSSAPAPPPPPRTSKKRARASRRAPTTVLTTDTSNFRAMVQEFTGIPSPPFSTSSFSRPRLDLLRHGAASATSGFLLRPFAQKLQPPPVPSASMAGISTSNFPSINTIQHQNFLLNSQNPLLSLQSVFQEQQRPMAMCQWTSSGYGGGELGSVIAGASAEADYLKRIMNVCKVNHSGSPHPEKQAAEGFSTVAPAARGEGGVDVWQLSSD